MEELTEKGHKENFPGEENVLYLDCGSCYKVLFICQSSSNYTLKVDALYFT